MKRCNNCSIDYEQGKFCRKCGAELVEVIIETPIKKNTDQSDVIRTEIKTVVDTPVITTQKNTKLKKEKPIKKDNQKKKRPLRILLIVLSVVLLLGVGLTGYYLNTSQVRVYSSYDFDKDEFYEVLYSDKFDGRQLSVDLDEDALNYYIADAIDKDDLKKLPFNIKIGEIGYHDDNNKIHIQLDNNLIHTTIILGINIHQEKNQLFFDIEDVTFGKWELPLPTDFILSKLNLPAAFEEGIELPEFIKIGPIEYNKKLASFDVELDKEYIEAMIFGAFEHIGPYLEYMKEYNLDARTFMNYYSLRNNWNDQLTKDFVLELSSDPSFASTSLLMLEQDYAENLLEEFYQDALYMEEALYLTVKREMDRGFLTLDNEYKSYVENVTYDETENVVKEIFEAVDAYFETLKIKKYIVSVDGKPYSVASGEFIDMNQLKLTVGYTQPAGKDYRLYSKNGVIHVGVTTPNGYSTYIENSTRKAYDTEAQAEYLFEYEDISSFGYAKVLRRGDADRTAIAEVVSAYTGSDNSMFIRYLKSDGEWAVLIASPGDNSQQIAEYVLEKYNGVWRVKRRSFSYNYSLDQVDEYLVSDGFNLTLLPNFEIKDYRVWSYTENYKQYFLDHLVDIGKTDAGDVVSYFSRIDDTMVISLESGKRFVIVFFENNQNEYSNLIEIGSSESYSDYHYLLNQQYDGAMPLHLFIQE